VLSDLSDIQVLALSSTDESTDSGSFVYKVYLGAGMSSTVVAVRAFTQTFFDSTEGT
jgi:hypothetical protein